MQPPKPVRAAKTAYTSPAARSNCARIAESMGSFFSLALAMAFTRAGCTNTTRSTRASTCSTNGAQNPHASTATAVSSAFVEELFKPAKY
jgi:hypothetical protein